MGAVAGGVGSIQPCGGQPDRAASSVARDPHPTQASVPQTVKECAGNGIDRHWDGIAAYCLPENKVSLGFLEGLNNKIRDLQRRASGLRDEKYLRLKILTCMLPKL